MKRNTLLAIRRNLGFGASCCVMALGIALVTNSNIGTTPISSIPYVTSLIFSVSMGLTTFVINIIFVAGQKLLLGRNFTRFHVMQIPAVLVFSLFINFWMWLTASLINQIYICQLLMVVGGSAILGLGISLELISKATVQPGEGILIAIAWRTRKEFARLKVIFDISLVAIAAACSWLAFQEIVGIREGTLISALITGPFVRFFSRFTAYLGPYFHGHHLIRATRRED